MATRKIRPRQFIDEFYPDSRDMQYHHHKLD